MCQWMAYSGSPVLAEELLFRPVHSIIDQSLHAKLGGVTTNGDGFGIGWYGDGLAPTVYKNILPAWSDENLREVAGQIRTPLMFAHVRASERNPRAAQQLPPLPVRPLVVDAQRVARPVPGTQARPGAGGGPLRCTR